MSSRFLLSLLCAFLLAACANKKEPIILGTLFLSADSALHLLWDKYPMIPTNNESGGIDRARWLTHYPNDAGLNGPDRTVDYLFYSPRIKRVEAMVRQDDTLRISDHLPVIARFLLPAAP